MKRLCTTETLCSATMNNDAPALLEDHKEKKIPFFEVVNAEKLWWALMLSKGLLNKDVQDLYRKARAGYENIILNDHEVVELQEVEYSLWKLHYKHIDGYRKRIRPTSANGTNMQNNIDIHMEGFKSFLSEAIEFYKNLIIKIRKCCALPKETFYKKGGGSNSVEIAKLHKFRYAHHRFLVCLGDLARYRELCKKPDNRKWSVVATYYLEASMVCPESGNPQNQLALLATYVGDDFLALYHCVRSLAVKEPFPDAGGNLMLLFEKSRSSHLPSLSSKAHIDFTKPSERSCLWTNSQGNKNSSNSLKMESTEHVSSGKTDLWPLFVRMISFFFIESSLEDFPCTFASTMRELESLLALDDIKLKASLESYEHMDSARRGPYRALQIVSTLIFIIHNLAENPESDNQKEKNHLALNATFICMGRLLERCNNLDSCRLLGSVLVFIEWLVGIIDRAEKCSSDEKVGSAILYFFGAFVDLLNRLDFKDGDVDKNAIWEDYELRGFVPIAHSHISLDFSTHLEYVENYDSGNECRARRLFLSAMKIVEKSRKWISYDKLRKKFYAKESKKIEDERTEARTSLEVKDRYQHKCGPGKEHENDIPEESQSQAQPCAKGDSDAVEEEEVILFRPITRHNSAPIYADEMSGENSREQTAASDECLRRASSLFDAQNRARPSNPFKQPEYPPAGPPSLSAWVVNRESLNIGKGSTRDFTRHELSPIQEIAPQSFTSLSISDSLNGSGHIMGPTHDSSSYVSPVPSAPLLPDDAVWFRGNSPNFKEADGILGASPLGGYPHWLAPLDYSPGLPGFIDGYLPFSGMSSSEWLYNYQNSHTLERGGNHVWPVHLNPLGNFNGHDASRFDVFNRTVYVEGPQLYPGPSPYGCGAGTELRAEQPPLLQYLKEREWQLQRDRGPHYMGN